MAWSSGPAMRAWSKSASTTCATGLRTGTRPWTTGRSAAARAWCSSRSRSSQAVESIWPERRPDQKVVLLSAQGRLFDQGVANRLSRESGLLLICGRYEGVDERVAEHLADDEISIGNYVLSGGELAAAVVIDAVARLLPGVLGNESSAAFESFQDTGHGEGLLDCPHWTRPADFRGWKAPEVLLKRQPRGDPQVPEGSALEKTARLRPDLLAGAGHVKIED